MAIETRAITYHHDDAVLEAAMAWDNTLGPRPGVLVSHAWRGRDAFSEEKARYMAELGYVGLALDMYGKGVRGSSKEENAALMTPLVDNRSRLRARIQLALEVLKAQDEVQADKTAAIGFCFGGLCVLELARDGADLQGVISFHGLLGRSEAPTASQIIPSVLVLHGDQDPMVSPEDILKLQAELSEADCDWQLHNFGNTLHAFTNPEANDPDFGTVYHPIANRRAWLLAEAFLAEVLGAD
jgi:dienelactone hydrolase